MDESQNESKDSQPAGDGSPAPAGAAVPSKKGSKKILIGLLVVVIIVLIHPISNFFLTRNLVGVSAGLPEFAKASAIMQNKCADCHSAGMMVEPIYYGYPYAGQLIADDMRIAQKHMKMTREHLTGEKKFSKKQLAKIDNVVANNDMPPTQYKIMHWNAGLTAPEKDTIMTWLKAEFAAARGH